jgi:hypothetical protein
LVIGIYVAIGKEQGLELWSIGVVEKNKDWSAQASGLESLRLGESNGVLGVKSEIDLIFTLLPISTIRQSITPILQVINLHL